ncbi:MAG: NAD(P)-dependent oxidoreductase [Micromonosporaceae bacterium]|nr:NAD(P)-dependent oxidoreductase [Micromonosporaceae bacterium]
MSPTAGGPVAVVGLGAMGLPMATRLADTFTVKGFDPAPARRELASRAGIEVCSTPAEAVAGARAIVLAVRDAAQTAAALFDVDGVVTAADRGSPVLLTGTIGVAAARDVAARLSEAGLVAVDAPVSGGPGRAATGELLIMVGAPADAVRAATPVLERLAARLVVVGPRVGDGQLLKTINQLLAGVHIAAAAEAVALARAAGLSPAVVVETLPAGAADSFMLRDRGPRMVHAATSPEAVPVHSRTDIFVKDLALVLDLAAGERVPAPVTAAAHQLYLLAQRHGLGARDDSSIVALLVPTADSEVPQA